MEKRWILRKIPLRYNRWLMLSVLIVNWNTRDLLVRCLESIRKFAPKLDFEVIVVDNASTDGSAERVRELFPEVRLIASPTNTGYARGNNLAFEQASGEWLLTLNPDTEFEDDALERSVARLASLDGYGCLSCRFIGREGETQRSVRGFPNLLGIFGDVSGLGRLFPASRLGSYRLRGFDYETEQDAAQPMGTFLLFRASALPDRRAPFDEDFPIFFNEVDLLYRMDRAGWKTRYVPDIHIRHMGGESTKQVRKSMIWESHRSLVRFLKKHNRSPLRAVGIWLASGLIFAGAFLRAKGMDAGFRP